LAPAVMGRSTGVVPSEATIRRTLARLDAETLAEVIGAWLADRDPRPAAASMGGRGGRQESSRRQA
jgi:hypothetical protein